MKKNIITISLFAIIMLWFSGCEENILDKTPLDKYSTSTVWKDADLADAFLKNAYHNLWSGYCNSHPTIGSISDEMMYSFTRGTDVYVMGTISPDNMGAWDKDMYGMRVFRPYGWNLFENVQVVNTFLDNIDKVSSAYPESRQAAIKARTDIMKGEALFIRAYSYAQMVRVWGALPYFKKPWILGDDYLSPTRGTFKESVDNIVADCDAAAALLKPKSVMESGRATNATALALKSRILLFAASDLTADGTAENECVGYKNADRTALWKAARDAAKAVIDLGIYGLDDFGAPNKAAVATGYFNFFKQKTLASKEVIWGKMFSPNLGDVQNRNQWNGPNGLNNWGADQPSQAMVDSYQMEDGSDFFNHFTIDANGYYVNKNTTQFKSANIYKNRDPRFYGSVLADSSIWQKRFANLAARDPLGIYERRTHIVIKDGKAVKTYGIDTRNGPVEDWNGSYTGYVIKKMMDDEVIGKTSPNTNIWIYFRYAEVLLNYAEACIGVGTAADLLEAKKYINLIRARAGMPEFTGDITKAVRQERSIELAFEDFRWYDIRRWKILENVLTNVKGIDIVETKNLDQGTLVTTYQQINCQNRMPSKKLLWVPISSTEMKKAPKLTQNTGY